MSIKTFTLTTLGCRVNQYETQSIREALLALGLRESGGEEKSDLYLINTCAVTGESVRKDRQVIRRALAQKEKDPNVVVCVCGCFSQGVSEDPVFEKVDVLCGNTRKGSLAPLLAELVSTPPEVRERLDLREDVSAVREYEPMSLCRSHNARAFIKIEDGCNSFCSYCYVPLVRGRVRSRGEEEILAEACRLAENGYREIVLTGIETGAYGTDLTPKRSLAELVERLHGLEGIERIRFGSLKPSLLTEELCARLAALPKVMPHFHLSFQSGSDAVLSRMGRRYTRREEEAALDAIDRYFPDAGLSADLICGFPGEREEDFAETASLVERAGLLHTHIFPFSPREGTKAATMADPVPEQVKKERCAALLAVAEKQSRAFAEKRVGKCYRVLCERVRGGAMEGYTENFIHTATRGEDFEVGRVYTVTLSPEVRFDSSTLTVLSNPSKEVDNRAKKL